MEKYSIDRFENNTVVCENENGEQFFFDKSSFPNTCNEGDIVVKLAGNRFEVLEEDTAAKKKELKNKLSKLFKKL